MKIDAKEIGSDFNSGLNPQVTLERSVGKYWNCVGGLCVGKVENIGAHICMYVRINAIKQIEILQNARTHFAHCLS